MLLGAAVKTALQFTCKPVGITLASSIHKLFAVAALLVVEPTVEVAFAVTAVTGHITGV